MPLYESTFIARQDMSRNDITRLTESAGKVISDLGGKVVKDEYWGLRNLAYKINKSRKGHYVMLSIDASASAIKELERVFSNDEDVMRFITIRVSALQDGPSVMMRNSSSRDDYGSGEDTAVA
ncbi:MAG: 30S ribosomal protein S6 [Rickettsiales bacterium]